MSLVGLVVTLIVVGVLLGLVNYYAPQIHMDRTILIILNVVVVVAVVIYVLYAFGLLPLGSTLAVPKVR
jgi:hypothetical protein